MTRQADGTSDVPAGAAAVVLARLGLLGSRGAVATADADDGATEP